ncbi:hypothetical protein KA977_08780 [Candidatus Dependentiae bacterium]|nr:hypothetical protein [Candidatus Dependentiae bacterium]
MRKKITNYSLIIVFFILSVLSYGYSFNAGVPLTLRYTAEHSALSAVTAFSSGINGILYNPALVKLEKYDRNFVSSYISLPQQISLYYLAFSKELEQDKNTRLSVFLSGIDGGSINQTMINGRDIEYTNNSSGYSGFQGGLSVSYNRNKIGYGFNLKNYSEKISGYKDNLILFDFGFLYKNIFENLDAGISALNIGSNIKINNSEEKISRIFSGGLKYSVYRFDILVDLKKIGELSPKFSYGINFRFDDNFHLMAGYNGTKDINNYISFGFGYFYNSLGIQYAYDNYDELGDLHYITISMSLKPLSNIFGIKKQKTDNDKLKINKKSVYKNDMGQNDKSNKTEYENKKSENKPEVKLNYETIDIGKLKENALKAFESKQYELAVIILQKIIYNQPEDIESIKLLGDVYFEIKDYDNAVKCYDMVQRIGLRKVK